MELKQKVQNKELIQHAAYAAIERILNEYFREENLYQVPPSKSSMVYTIIRSRNVNG